jgi:hypothetical protein
MLLKINLKKQLQPLLTRYREYILVSAVILAALLIRLGLLLHTVDFHGISNGKIVQALLIISNPGNIRYWTPVHPPAHFLFVICGLKLFAPLLIAPRFISLGFGIMTLIAAYLYIKLVFNQETALFSLLGISLYSAHIIYSIIGTSETSFHFFLFLSLYVYELFIQENKKYLLSVLGLCVGLASMCRYEGLLLIPFYMVFLRARKPELIKFTAYALILPGIWMLVNYLAFGNALEFILTNNFIVPFQVNWIRTQGINVDFFYKLFFWPKTLIQTLGPGVFYLGISGVVYSAVKSDKKMFSAMFIMFFSVFVFNTIRETLYLQPRYAITLGLILIPFSIDCFFKLIEFFSRRIPQYLVLILLWTMIIPIGNQVLVSSLFVPLFAKNTALYLQNHSQDIEDIIMDDCGDEKYREPIKVLSRINPQRFILMPKILNAQGAYVVDEKEFFKALSSKQLTTLLYSPYGGLNPILNLNTQTAPQQRQGFLFTLKYKAAPYYIYEIKKVKANE